MPVTLFLPGIEATLALGRLLAQALPVDAPYQTVLLDGGMGAGKTTLTRGFVEALPGGGDAEVSSPSFNLCNVYPTRPEVVHCDLYRLEGMPPDDDLLETLEAGDRLVIVEWAQYLSAPFRPSCHLLLRWLPGESGRTVAITATGETARRYRDELYPRLSSVGRGNDIRIM
ncbi:MAG: tRNA (adenosine(37)-N6)-threonylcarbamoyltransferase complex ATPase subunit type 1 TsaE [Desulfovibrionaceae bacterium]